MFSKCIEFPWLLSPKTSGLVGDSAINVTALLDTNALIHYTVLVANDNL